MLEEKHSTDAFDIRVTLLGTGGVTPVMERFGASTLIEAGGQFILFDAGRGALQRLFQLRIPLKELRTLFLTHLHLDHTVGLPDLWRIGWVVGQPEIPLHVWGPQGTKSMMAHIEQAFPGDSNPPPVGATALVEEVTDGFVYEHKGVKVTAFQVEHSPIRPTFGYRIDYGGHAVVLSGDTYSSENLIKRAQGVDVLVHEVIADEMVLAERGNTERTKKTIATHTTAEQAGEVFARVQPKLAVFNHVIPIEATAKELIPPTRKTYSGPLEVGEDLMVIEIGDNVTVRRPISPAKGSAR